MRVLTSCASGLLAGGLLLLLQLPALAGGVQADASLGLANHRPGQVALRAHRRALQRATGMEWVDDKYESRAEKGFYEKCLPAWQEDCRRLVKDTQIRDEVCDSHLERSYCMISLLVPEEDAAARFALSRPHRQFDAGWFSANLPHFTPTGFKKVRLPEELHSAFHTWFLQERKAGHVAPEFQSVFGNQCGSGYDNDDWVLNWGNSEAFRKTITRLEDHIMQTLAEWTGQNVNERTSVYGVRLYHRGSVCGLHTDQHNTHAFSAIYNVHQTNIDEPWALDYVAHDGTKGRVFQEPGDLVLYESASSLHGRTSPLQGDEYANIFFHFRSPEWLPAVEKAMKPYWQERDEYEAKIGSHVYTEPTAKVREILVEDSCLPLKNRSHALLGTSGAFDPPKPGEWSAKAV